MHRVQNGKQGDPDVDARHFDALTCVLRAASSRRRLLSMFAAMAVTGGSSSPDLADEAAAKDRRRRRKQRHKRRQSSRNRKKTRCQRKSLTEICEGLCGTVTSSQSCGRPVDCGTTCPNASTVCCEGLCQTSAELNAACPSSNTPGFLTFSNGDMRCASQQVEACSCLGGIFRECAPGTVCKAQGNGILCDWPSST